VTADVVPQRAVLVAATTAEFDSRIQRLASGLRSRGHDVTIVARGGGAATTADGSAGSTADGVPIRRIALDRAVLLPGPLRPLARRLGRVIAGILPSRLVRMPAVLLDALAQGRLAAALVPAADVWHARGLLAVPTALALRDRHGGRVVYDAGDLYVDARNLARLPSPIRALVGRWERRLARRADALVTVNDGYRDVLGRRFGRPLTVVLNSPDTLPPTTDDPIRAALGLAQDIRVVLYHGGLTRDRGIEQLIAAMADVPGAVLVLMGYGDHQADLVARAAAEPNGRLRLLPPVRPGQVLPWVASADVAAMLIQPTTLNHRLTTPNKLFEAMAAGTPVLAADLPGMRSIVESSGCGRLVDPTDVGAIAATLREMVEAPAEQRMAWSEAGRRAIETTYGWGRQMDALTKVYRGLTGKPW